MTHVVVETKSSANEVDTMSSGMKIQISSTYYKTFYIFFLKKKKKKKYYFALLIRSFYHTVVPFVLYYLKFQVFLTIFFHYFRYSKQDLELQGDFAFGAEEQFANEAKMAVRLANFISAFLQVKNLHRIYSLNIFV